MDITQTACNECKTQEKARIIRRLVALLVGIMLVPVMFAATTSNLIEVDGIYYILQDKPFTDASGTYSGTASVVPPENNRSKNYELQKALIPSTVFDEDNKPYKVTTIELGAFYNAGKLEEVSIPGSITNFGTSAFVFCKNLKKIRFEKSTEILNIPRNVFVHNNPNPNINRTLYIGRQISVAAQDTSLARMLKPEICEIEDVEVINNNYLYEGNTIKELILHEGLIRLETLYNCSQLSELNIPAGVLYLGVQEIDESKSRGLEYMNSLEKVTLPSSLVKMAGFFDSEQLSDIYIHALNPPTVVGLYTKVPFPEKGEGKVHVKTESVDIYNATVAWKSDRYEIVGDLAANAKNVSVSLCSEGAGKVRIVAINGELNTADSEANAGQNIEVAIPDAATIDVAAIPEAGFDVALLTATDGEDNLLPLSVRKYGAQTVLSLNASDGMKVKAQFDEQISATLYLFLPSTAAHTSLNIPQGGDYKFHYTCSPGYILSNVLLDDEELTFDKEQTENLIQPRNELPSKTERYSITVPAFEGERNLRIVEVADGTITSIDKNGLKQEGAAIEYINGNCFVKGLQLNELVKVYNMSGELISNHISQNGVVKLPSTLQGFYIIKTSAKTFKATL